MTTQTHYGIIPGPFRDAVSTHEAIEGHNHRELTMFNEFGVLTSPELKSEVEDLEKNLRDILSKAEGDITQIRALESVVIGTVTVMFAEEILLRQMTLRKAKQTT